MMKKGCSLLLALLITLSLAACGGNETQTPAEGQRPTESADAAGPAGSEDSYYPVTITTYDYEGN